MLFCGLLIGSIFTSLLYGIHLFVAFLMIVIILMQAAKGGGLSGAFGAGVGSSPLFGAATSTVLVRTTTALAIIFAITCMSLAAIQSRKSPIPKAPKKSTEEVEKVTTGKEEPPVALEKEAEEKKEGEGALSPVEAEAEEKEKATAEGEKPSPTEEKPLSPVEAGAEEKEKGAAEDEEPSPTEEKPLSPVEAGGEEKPTPPAAPENETSPPAEDETPADKT